MYIAILNGPNLNLQGRREQGVYGTESMDSALQRIMALMPEGAAIQYAQTNSEAELIGYIHTYGLDPDCAGIALNAGAFTHTSLAIADAVRAVEAPVVEVHISNVWARTDEPLRHRSLLAPACRGVIAGFGLDSYRLAVEALLEANKGKA